MNIHTNFKDYVYAQNTVMDMGADGALYFEPDSVSGGNNPPGDGEILLLCGLRAYRTIRDNTDFRRLQNKA